MATKTLGKFSAMSARILDMAKQKKRILSESEREQQKLAAKAGAKFFCNWNVIGRDLVIDFGATGNTIKIEINL